jgi:hypothetical protein
MREITNKSNMSRLFLFFFSILIISCNTKEGDYTLLIPGKGFDDVAINETTIDDIIRLFGENCKIDTHFVNYNLSSYLDSLDLSESRTIFSISYIYDSLGLIFCCKPGINEIFAIECKSPFKCKTEKGIILDSSSFNDVIEAYGNCKWNFTENTLIKSYEGIEFIGPYSNGFPPDLTDSLRYYKEKLLR